MSATDGRRPADPALPQVPIRHTSLKGFLDLVIMEIILVQLLIVMGTLEVTQYK